METSTEVNQIIKALVEAEKKFEKIELTKTGQAGSREFKYADLTEVYNKTKPALQENGLKMVGTLSIAPDNSNILAMTLYHISGQWIRSSMKLPTTSGKPTEMGAIFTYMRRYLYNTLLGIAADEDVEGTALDNCSPTTKATKAPNYIDDFTRTKIKDAINNDMDLEDIFLKAANVLDIEYAQITKGQAAAGMKAVNAEKERRSKS